MRRACDYFLESPADLRAILVDEGYASLSTRKIAARAGMLPGNLHYYYSTKHEVVRALLDRYLERATARIETRIVNAQSAPTDDPAEAALSVLFADQTNLESCRFFWELWALAARDPAVSEAMRGFYLNYWRALVAKLLLRQSKWDAAISALSEPGPTPRGTSLEMSFFPLSQNTMPSSLPKYAVMARGDLTVTVR